MKTRKNKTLRAAFLSVFALTGIVAAGVAIECSHPSPVEVKADIPSGLYDACEAAVNASTFNKDTLYSALKTAANSGYKVGSYDSLWTWYETTDVRSDGKIRDWYSEDTNFSTGSGDHCGNYQSIGDCFNREHSIPKSWWGGGTSNQGCDIYIVVPTDGKINGMRSNYPFGEVGSSYDLWGKNKLGNGSSASGYTGKVFEPYDSMKGDFARVYLYAVCKWSNVSMTSGDGSQCFQSGTYSSSNNFGLTNYAKNLFYKWHKADPVDSVEIDRNNKAQSKQGNRNPFIDHPEYADYLWGGITPSTKDVESVSVSPTSTSLIYGQTKQLTPTVLPSDAPQTVSYTSSNSNVASVSDSGLITAGNTTGTATITVKSTKDTTKQATCTVTVSAPSPVALTGVSASNVNVSTGSTQTINPTYTPSNAYPIPTYSYVSNNTSIATVTSAGVVSGVSEGSTTISITASQSGGASVSTTINVTVTAAPIITSASIVPTDLANAYESVDTEHTSADGGFKFKTNLCANYSSKIQFKKSSGYLYSSASANLNSLTITGGSGTITVYGCNSSGTTGTEVTGSSNVYDLSSYKYFCLKNNASNAYTCTKIDIKLGSPSPVGPTVTLNKSSTSLTVGSSETLTATTTGTGTLSWSSNNNSVATVSNGKITAVAAGTATITASYGGATDTCVVTVTNPSGPSVSLDKSSLSLTVGGTSTLHATTSGSGTLTWSTSKASVATVSNGTVTAVGEGSATITASYGGATATCNVTVTSASFVNSIKECYSKSAGASCSNIYGLYVGSVNGGQSSIIMNGEYGIMLYLKAPESTWVENETYLKVGTSTLDIYNNLYELKSCNNITTITDQSVISANIAPVVTYKVTGSESASDLSIANRLCTVTFKVSSGSVTVGSDSTLTINVNSHTFSLFIKKTEATAALKSFFDAAGTTKTVTAQGYTSFYKTNFQISFKKIIEEEDTYTAEAFAQDLLNLTNETCSYSEQHGWADVKSTLSPIWLTLEGENYYAKLPAAQKEILASAVGSKTGTTIEIAIDRYDHIVARYGLNNFITGRTVLALNFNNFFNNEIKESSISLIVIISVVGVTALGGFILLKKRREN